jgi:hypothetical protein
MVDREFKRRFVLWGARLYGIGFFVSLILLQIRLFRAEGPFNWLLLGFVIPFFEALVWPVQVIAWMQG